MTYKISEEDKKELVDRFIRYCEIDTHSNPDLEGIPSTKIQFDLARLLVKELEEIGLKPRLSENCFVYASVPENKPTKQIVGLICHMDVSSDAPSANIKPIIHKNITGEDLKLPSGTIIPSANLKKYKGQDIITSDGTTLLGADDKAGVASVMQFLTILQREGNALPHGRLEICFCPDEEIGRGLNEGLDMKEFPVEVAYTVDGSEVGSIECENFNAKLVKIDIEGKGIHPGYAYGFMVNALVIASDIISAIPKVYFILFYLFNLFIYF